MKLWYSTSDAYQRTGMTVERGVLIEAQVG